MNTTEPTPRERLLDALDQLTKPVRQVRWKETGHDHEWRRLHEWIPAACTCPPGVDRPERCPSRSDGEHREGALLDGWSCRWCGALSDSPIQEPGELAVFRNEDAPLLDQLREAIGNNIGGAGGGKSPRERTPIDVAAFSLHEAIDGRVRAWMMEMGATPGKDLTATQMLPSWYVLWSAGNPADIDLLRHAAVLEAWERGILDVLAPPKRIEITSACPVCGNEWINVGLKLPNGEDDPDDVERVRVLVAVERESIDKSFAMCRACEKVWLGVGPMRQLRIAIDDAEAAKVEGLSA